MKEGSFGERLENGNSNQAADLASPVDAIALESEVSRLTTEYLHEGKYCWIKGQQAGANRLCCTEWVTNPGHLSAQQGIEHVGLTQELEDRLQSFQTLFKCTLVICHWSAKEVTSSSHVSAVRTGLQQSAN